MGNAVAVLASTAKPSSSDELTVKVSRMKTSSLSRSACPNSKMGSRSSTPVALEHWKSIGSRESSGKSLIVAYSPLPPMALQKPAGSLPSARTSSLRSPCSAAAILSTAACSASLAPTPFHA